MGPVATQSAPLVELLLGRAPPHLFRRPFGRSTVNHERVRSCSLGWPFPCTAHHDRAGLPNATEEKAAIPKNHGLAAAMGG